MSIAENLPSTIQTNTACTLAELRCVILADQSLSETRGRDMASAVQSLGKALGRPLDTIPTEVVALRPMLKGLTPAMVGLKPGRWRNILSLTTAALSLIGAVKVQGRLRTEPSPAWQTLLHLLPPNPGRTYHLRRFARYCTERGIEPPQIDDAVLNQYQRDLETHSLVDGPARCAREVARVWNDSADALELWPQLRLTVPDNRNTFGLAWESLPDTLQQDIAAWCKWLGSSDPFEDRPFEPLKPASIETHRRHLRPYLGALLAKGIPMEALVDLDAIVTPERARLALNFFWERAGKSKTVYLYQMTSLVMMIARHWAELPEADIAQLERMKKRLRPEQTGLTPRNMAVLRQFEDPTRLKALLALPGVLMAKAKALGTPTVHAARLAQTAAAVELLLHVPLRLRNLRELRIGTQLQTSTPGRMVIDVPTGQVKNGVAANGCLQRDVAALVGTYLDRYRQLLDPHGTEWVFPGKKSDRPKSDDGMRRPICKAIAEYCGVTIRPHQFRHFAAWLILRQNPSAHGQVQRVLGHKSLQTTMSFYSGLETSAALAHYDDLITNERQAAAGLPENPPNRKTRRPKAGA